MTGTAKIFAALDPSESLLTRQVERYLRVEFWSWW